MSVGRADATEQANGDKIAAWLEEHADELGIRNVLWWVENHFDHIHTDFYPRGEGIPPLKTTGIGEFKGSNGEIVKAQIQVVPMEGTGLKEGQMTPTQARLEIAAGWHSRTGVWMSADDDETAQERLTRLSQEAVDGKRTVEDIVRFAGEPKPQKNEPIPAWVIDPHAADTPLND